MKIKPQMKLLILAGTQEARTIIDLTDQVLSIKLIASYVTSPRKRLQRDVEIRTGGFGGDDGFRAFLRTREITTVLDATHPFATIMSARAARICRQSAVPHLKLLRPPWTPVEGDNWIIASSINAASKKIPPHAVVFLASGRQNLPAFGKVNARLFCRQLDPPSTPFPFQNGVFLHGNPPFSFADECALFKRLKITHLVSKNAGGMASYTKIEAARACAIPVIMIERPALAPFIQTVATEVEAIEWIKAQI